MASLSSRCCRRCLQLACTRNTVHKRHFTPLFSLTRRTRNSTIICAATNKLASKSSPATVTQYSTDTVRPADPVPGSTPGPSGSPNVTAHTSCAATGDDHSCTTKVPNDSVHADTTTKRARMLHEPVMAREVVDVLSPKDGQVILDMTFGAGGHTRALLDEAPGIRVFCLDRDPHAYDLARGLATDYPQVTPLLGRFSEVDTLLAQHGIADGEVDAVIFDLGASSMQFDTAERGFSLSHDAPLDMRMDGDRLGGEQPSASDVVNWMDEAGLFRIIKKYGEDKNARLIARAIIDSRYAFGRIETTHQLADIVAAAIPGADRHVKFGGQAHVATKTFQALRIFVNNELNELHNGLEVALRLLRAGSGVCAAISFHSLEDRIVKQHFVGAAGAANVKVGHEHRSGTRTFPQPLLQLLLQRRWRPLFERVVAASEAEVRANRRARSSKLRAAVKL